VEIFREDGVKPERIAKNALEIAKRRQFNLLIVDTAGRMQMNDELIKEIRRIEEAVESDEVLLVADAMTGQSAVEIARSFDEALNLSGIILSKFDSDARGGATLLFKSVAGKPVKFIGVGEKPEELEPFHPDRIASRILGMGDIVSLVEKARKYDRYVNDRTSAGENSQVRIYPGGLSGAVFQDEENGRNEIDARNDARYGRTHR